LTELEGPYHTVRLRYAPIRALGSRFPLRSLTRGPVKIDGKPRWNRPSELLETNGRYDLGSTSLLSKVSTPV